LKIQQFPVVFNSAFKLQLNAWYNCDDKTSSLFDDAMDYRRKMVSIDIPHVGNKLTINLESFEFSDTDKKIVGCIRWIPKLISSTGSKEGKIVYIDNYASTANVQPIPLTTKRLKLFQQKHADTQQADKLTNRDGNDDDGDDDASDLQIATAFGTGHDDEGDEEDIDNLKDYANVGQENYLYL
ncbi:unnamed protein product, partial [Rotaria magnacalcarata]